MNGEPTERQLMEAEIQLARALQRLSALRRAALCGSYDMEEFDRAVMAYRAAEAEIAQARRAQAAGQQQSQLSRLSAAVAEDEPHSPIMPTAHLLFAKWLVETGRLSG